MAGARPLAPPAPQAAPAAPSLPQDALGSPLGEDFAFTPQADPTARSTGRRGSIARSSVSPAEMRSARAVSKRATAAEWLASVTGEPAVPHERDDDFRAALGDGVLLCKLLNALQPGAIPRVGAAAGWGRVTRAQAGTLVT